LLEFCFFHFTFHARQAKGRPDLLAVLLERITTLTEKVDNLQQGQDAASSVPSVVGGNPSPVRRRYSASANYVAHLTAEEVQKPPCPPAPFAAHTKKRHGKRHGALVNLVRRTVFKKKCVDGFHFKYGTKLCIFTRIYPIQLEFVLFGLNSYLSVRLLTFLVVFCVLEYRFFTFCGSPQVNEAPRKRTPPHLNLRFLCIIVKILFILIFVIRA